MQAIALQDMGSQPFWLNESPKWHRYLVMISLPQLRAIVRTNFQIRKMLL
jgi:hypothetical protein